MSSAHDSTAAARPPRDSALARPVPFLSQSFKQRIAARGLGRIWGHIRGGQQYREHVRWREYYVAEAERRQIVHSDAQTLRLVRERLRARGATPKLRAPGEVHSFVFLPGRRPHPHLLPDMHELGPVSLFDYEQLGYRVSEFRRGDNAGLARRREMNNLIVPALRDAHARRPVDWVFMYGNGSELAATTVQQIVDEFGVPVVTVSMDDTHSWEGPLMDGQPAGQRGLASVFDLTWTTAPMAREWFLVEGGRPVFMPVGVDLSAYRPSGKPQDIPVSFVGQAYGFRPAVIAHLRRHGVPVQTFGRGWSASSYAEDLIDITNRSRINLGMGGMAYNEMLTHIKGRDFDVPATGGGVYITSFNPDLVDQYRIGQEIVCYRSRDELLELVRYYLKHPDEARAIAQAGRARCLKQHRWRHRYERLLRIVGVLPDEGAPTP